MSDYGQTSESMANNQLAALFLGPSKAGFFQAACFVSDFPPRIQHVTAHTAATSPIVLVLSL